MSKQADQLAATLKNGNYTSLKYVTVMLGANDACVGDAVLGSSVESMRENFRAGFDRLAAIQQHEPVHVLVSGMPKIPELGRPDIRDHMTLQNNTCQEARDILGLCGGLLNWNSDADYRKFVSLVAERNRIIQEVALEAAIVHLNLRIHFSNQFFKTPITTTKLAADCFHPNKAGQQEISEVLWKEQPWFK